MLGFKLSSLVLLYFVIFAYYRLSISFVSIYVLLVGTICASNYCYRI